MRPRDWIQQRRRRGIDNGPKESTKTTEASKEEDEYEGYNNKNGYVGGGYTMRLRDQRRRQRRQQIYDGSGGLETATEY